VARVAAACTSAPKSNDHNNDDDVVNTRSKVMGWWVGVGAAAAVGVAVGIAPPHALAVGSFASRPGVRLVSCAVTIVRGHQLNRVLTQSNDVNSASQPCLAGAGEKPPPVRDMEGGCTLGALDLYSSVRATFSLEVGTGALPEAILDLAVGGCCTHSLAPGGVRPTYWLHGTFWVSSIECVLTVRPSHYDRVVTPGCQKTVTWTIGCINLDVL
jgi:hypothetical protein